jgi:hypothetical protein
LPTNCGIDKNNGPGTSRLGIKEIMTRSIFCIRGSL